MNFLHYVLRFADAFTEAQDQPFSVPVDGRVQPVHDGRPLALIFAPHPDDESITGLLPLRLQLQANWQVAVVPVTHGSDPLRQEQRHAELHAACALLGWGLLESPAASGAEPRPAHQIDTVLSLLKIHRPDLVVFPHEADWNLRHIATHRLLSAALSQMPDAFSCHVVETEYWRAMDDPNLMVQASPELLAQLIAATACHKGEVSRNPYHLLLPAWMMDNVRRGAELISGQGGSAPDYTFATLYRHSLWRNRSMLRCPKRLLSLTRNPADIFQTALTH